MLDIIKKFLAPTQSWVQRLICHECKEKSEMKWPKLEIPDVKYISLQGDVSINTRTQAIKQFQNNKDIKVCFISINSSAEGINLISANHLVLVDLWWNDAKMSQVSDRIHRIGQDKQVIIYKLKINNSIEEQIEKMVKKKNKISKLILNSWEEPEDATFIDEHIQLIERPVLIE